MESVVFFDNFSSSLSSCLKNNNILTREALLKLTEEQAWNLNGLERPLWHELLGWMTENNLCFNINNYEAFLNGFSRRTRNCLRNANIRTLNELLDCTEIKLLKTRNFGPASLEEIKTVLASHGLKLKSVDSDIDNNFTGSTYSWLYEAGIKTLDELLNKNDGFFLALIENHRNHFGKGCYKEVKEFLAKNNLSLKE